MKHVFVRGYDGKWIDTGSLSSWGMTDLTDDEACRKLKDFLSFSCEREIEVEIRDVNGIS